MPTRLRGDTAARPARAARVTPASSSARFVQLIVLGLIQLTGGVSLVGGNTYGRFIGIAGGSLGAIGALLSIGGAYPWWSLAIFFLCIYIVHGIFIYGDDDRALRA